MATSTGQQRKRVGDKNASAGWLGQDGWNRKAWAGQPGQDSHSRKAWEGQPGQDIQDRTFRTGQPENVGMMQAGQEKRDRMART
jgi:hypothetical protein